MKHRDLLVLAASAIVLPALAGCQRMVAGHWTLLETTPNRELFRIEDATFNKDGSYSATTTVEGRTTVEKGQYDFNGFKLRLLPAAGGQHIYDAVLKVNRLELSSGSRRVILKKSGS